MNAEFSNLISELETISVDAQATFGNLSAQQINWKSDVNGWSVGQCFEHLIKANALFFPEIEQIAAGARKNSFLEDYSPLSGFFGNIIVNTLKKDERKIKAPTPKIVPPGEIDARIVEQFAAHQNELIERIKQTSAADWRKIKLTSPLARVVTYRLADGFRIVVEHERRHVRQAARVLEAANFPVENV